MAKLRSKVLFITTSPRTPEKMVEDSHKASHVLEPRHVKRLFEYSNELAISCHDEKTWYGMLQEKALSWLVWD